MRPPIPIAIAVVRRGDQYLVGQRPPGKPLAGCWEFPGGHVACGETAAAAAVRECWEEAGLEVEVLEPCGEWVHDYEHGSLKLSFFACRLRGKDRPPKKPFRWMYRHELAHCKFPAANERLLAELISAKC